MDERMVHYVGGPLDGLTGLMEENRHPFVIDVNTDTDGYYVTEYSVAGQRIGAGELTLTADDVVARWHQRSSPEDFQVGDAVIIKATGERATAVLPTTRVYEDGMDEGWMIQTSSSPRPSSEARAADLRFVTPDQIRIATADELRDEGSPD